MDSTTKFVLGAGGTLALLLFLDQRAWSKALTSSGDKQDVIPPFYSPTDFIKLYYPLAVRYNAGGSIPAVFTIAQAGIESAWGTSYKFMHFRNVFGIKAGKNWPGDTDGKGFRAYDSVDDSFADHADLLSKDPRYASALDPLNASDPITFAQIIAPIYTPDAGYADLLKRTIKKVDTIIS